MPSNHRVRTCLWFDKDGEAAANAYVALIPNSEIEDVVRAQPGGDAIVVNFTLGGAPFQILNGGPHYKATPAASISVLTEDQAETDRLWDALIADGGEAGRCAWLEDRFGISWQIVPKALAEMLGAKDRAAAGRAQAAMMEMNKIEIATLEAAFAAS
ncbi:VOC family protein [Devosia rhodophyticola]|uniref:VOC family protein n=1 Tax=Devosia rhodophyticola TaxID=3026423 RepID=A0ABY7YTY5_9HYPH|nr:VOC family protein [Devosia rhodophyticola]WDR04667.1 VOC family protein [Devosia rhodophyticola]